MAEDRQLSFDDYLACNGALAGKTMKELIADGLLRRGQVYHDGNNNRISYKIFHVPDEINDTVQATVYEGGREKFVTIISSGRYGELYLK